MLLFLAVFLTNCCFENPLFAGRGGHAGHAAHAHCAPASHARSGGHRSYRVRAYSRGRGWNRVGGSNPAPKPQYCQLDLSDVPEVIAGIGTFTGTQISDSTIRRAGPAYNVGVKIHVTRGFAISISAGMQQYSGRDTCSCANPDGLYNPFEYHITNRSLMLGADVMYGSNRNFQFYGGLALGLTVYSEDDTHDDGKHSSYSGSRWAWQLTALGVRYGHALGAYAELGVGYKGVINAGISYQGWRGGRHHL